MTKQEAFARLESFEEGIPFEAIRFLYEHEPDAEILEKIRFALEHAFDDDLYFDDRTARYCYAPLWYAIVAEQYQDLSLLPPLIALYTEYDGNYDFLEEQGIVLLEKLWEKFGDEAVLPTMDALDRVMETPSDFPYLFLFNCLRYADASQLPRVISWLDNPNNHWLDALIGHMADCMQFRGVLPKLQEIEAKYLAETNWKQSKGFGDKLFLGELKYAIRQIEKGEPGNEPFSKTRGHWEEHYRAFEKNFITPKPKPKVPEPKKSAKVGRNDPCPCGSGKKYKKCCWGKGIF